MRRTGKRISLPAMAIDVSATLNGVFAAVGAAVPGSAQPASAPTVNAAEVLNRERRSIALSPSRRSGDGRPSAPPPRAKRDASALQRQLGEVAPAVEDQRRGARPARAALDLADEDDVVAFLVLAAVEAFEHRRRALEQRRAARALAPGEAGEAVRRLAGEALGQVVL